MLLLRIKNLALFICVLALCSCATQSPITNTDESWRARGKFSFRSDETRESGNFDWRQSGQVYRVRLYGPLGLGTVQINGDGEQASIRSSKEERSSLDPDILIYEMTGMHLPITDIPDWLTGKAPTFHAENTEFDHHGNLTQTFVHGWQINYDDYSKDSQLPGNIIATQGNTTLRLVVLDWEG